MKDYVDQMQAQWKELHPEIDSAPTSVISRVLRLARILQVQGDAVLAAHDVTRAEFDVLSLLARTGRAMTPSELASELLTSAPGITKRIKKLVEAGLVERIDNPADGRGAFIHLTTLAEHRLPPILHAIWQFESGLLDETSPTDQQALANQLRTLLVHIEPGATHQRAASSSSPQNNP